MTNTGNNWDNNGGSDYRIKINTTTSIKEIDSDTDAQAEYYTLQGVRVDNPSPGIYICRKGSNVKKIIVR